jgi:hypothetical protein
MHLNGRANDLPRDIILLAFGSYPAIYFCQGFSHPRVRI